MSETRQPARRPDEPGGIMTFEELLTMTPAEAEAAGMRGAWNLARLRQLVSEAVTGSPDPPAKPPSVFVSYRWESAAHQAWVARLAQDLTSRGYDVFFDQELQRGREQPLPVPELISSMTRCTCFLFVLSEGYLQRIVGAQGRLQDGWVWDEYQIAMELFEIGRLTSFVCVWRSGALPDWLQERQVWDFRDDASYPALVEQAFPRRFANIVGVRADGSTRIVGPVERVLVNEAGRQLEATETFDHFLIEHL